jgi:hypothetical protein
MQVKIAGWRGLDLSTCLQKMFSRSGKILKFSMNLMIILNIIYRTSKQNDIDRSCNC